MDDYDVFFNIVFTSFNGWAPAVVAVGALVLAIGVWVVKDEPESGAAELSGAGPKQLISAISGVIAFFAALATLASWLQFNDLRAALREGRVESARGVVHYSERGKFDRFSLEGHAFEFGPSDTGGGFNEPVREHGPNLEGRCVLIFYEPNSNAIVWLGIRRSRCDADDVSAPPPVRTPPALPAGPPPRR